MLPRYGYSLPSIESEVVADYILRMDKCEECDAETTSWRWRMCDVMANRRRGCFEVRVVCDECGSEEQIDIPMEGY